MKTRAKSIVRDKCMIDARHVVRDRALAGLSPALWQFFSR